MGTKGASAKPGFGVFPGHGMQEERTERNIKEKSDGVALGNHPTKRDGVGELNANEQTEDEGRERSKDC